MNTIFLAEACRKDDAQCAVTVLVQVTAGGRRGPEGAHHHRLLTPDSTDPLHTPHTAARQAHASLATGDQELGNGHQQNIPPSLSVLYPSVD